MIQPPLPPPSLEEFRRDPLAFQRVEEANRKIHAKNVRMALWFAGSQAFCAIVAAVIVAFVYLALTT